MEEKRVRQEERVMQIDISRPNLGLTVGTIAILTIVLILSSYLLVDLF